MADCGVRLERNSPQGSPCASLAACAPAMKPLEVTPIKRERVDPGWTWTKKLNFWVGWKLGDTVQLSGLVAFDSEGGVVGEGDYYAQTIQVYKPLTLIISSMQQATRIIITLFYPMDIN